MPGRKPRYLYVIFNFLEHEQLRLSEACRDERNVGAGTPTYGENFADAHGFFFLETPDKERVSEIERTIRNKRLRSLTVN